MEKKFEEKIIEVFERYGWQVVSEFEIKGVGVLENALCINDEVVGALELGAIECTSREDFQSLIEINPAMMEECNLSFVIVALESKIFKITKTKIIELTEMITPGTYDQEDDLPALSIEDLVAEFKEIKYTHKSAGGFGSSIQIGQYGFATFNSFTSTQNEIDERMTQVIKKQEAILEQFKFIAENTLINHQYLTKREMTQKLGIPATLVDRMVHCADASRYTYRTSEAVNAKFLIDVKTFMEYMPKYGKHEI